MKRQLTSGWTLAYTCDKTKHEQFFSIYGRNMTMVGIDEKYSKAYHEHRYKSTYNWQIHPSSQFFSQCLTSTKSNNSRLMIKNKDTLKLTQKLTWKHWIKKVIVHVCLAKMCTQIFLFESSNNQTILEFSNIYADLQNKIHWKNKYQSVISRNQKFFLPISAAASFFLWFHEITTCIYTALF